MRRSLHAISLVIALWAVPAFAQVEGDFSLGGGIRIGDSTTTCNAAAEGAILYDSSATKVLQFCNGAAWQNVGGGTPSFPLVANPIGSVNAPAYTFTGDLNTGLYSPGADILAITVGGGGPSANAGDVIRFTSVADGRNYLSISGGTSSLAPVITNAGSSVTGDSLGISIIGKTALGTDNDGGPITLTGGNGAPAGLSAHGGAIAITGGQGNTNGGGGNSGTGGDVNIGGGPGGNNNGAGGNLAFWGGGGRPGGDIDITAGGGGNGNWAGGAVTILGGRGSGTVAGGYAELSGGLGSETTSDGGAAKVTGGPTTGGNGGAVIIAAANGAGTNKNGGSVTISAGTATGVGTPGSIEFSSAMLRISNDVLAPMLGASTNDYAPADLATAARLRVRASTPVNITGLAGGADGRVMTLTNISANTITLTDEDAASTAANRFALTGNISLTQDKSVMMIYDSVSQRWRAMGDGASGGAGLVTDLPQNISFSGDITDAPGTDQNNYNPAGLATASVIRLNASAGIDITGLAGGADGRVIQIQNITASTKITLVHASTSSIAANRFALPDGADLLVEEGQSVQLWYDSTSSRWRLVGFGGYDFPGLGVGLTGGREVTFTDDGSDDDLWFYFGGIADANRWNLATSGGDKVAIGSENGTQQSGFVFEQPDSATEVIFGVAASSDTGTSWNPRFVVRQDGKVGIGTAAPQASLHIEGEAIIRTTGISCTSALDGALRFTSSTDVWEFCNGSAWIPFKTPCTNDGTGACWLDATRSTSDPDFSAANIASGVNILGVTGTLVACGTNGLNHAGACWYVGGSNVSCTTVCASHGGYNGVTSTYAGSAGTTANCTNLFNAFGFGPAGLSQNPAGACPAGLGCIVQQHCTSPATTAGAASAGTNRFCACLN